MTRVEATRMCSGWARPWDATTDKAKGTAGRPKSIEAVHPECFVCKLKDCKYASAYTCPYIGGGK